MMNDKWRRWERAAIFECGIFVIVVCHGKETVSRNYLTGNKTGWNNLAEDNRVFCAGGARDVAGPAMNGFISKNGKGKGFFGSIGNAEIFVSEKLLRTCAWW